MKKIFTLIVAAFMAVSVNASEEIGAGLASWTSWNPSAVTLTGSTVSFTGGWQGAGIWLGSKDASAYDYLYIKYSSSTDAVISFGVNYNEITAQESWGAAYASSSTQIEPSETGGYAVVKLDKTNKFTAYDSKTKLGADADQNPTVGNTYATSLRQIYLQSQSASATITVEDVKLLTTAEYDAIKAANTPASVTIFEGSNDFGTEWSWPNSILISSSKFANVSVGTVIKFTFSENSDATYWQLKTVDGTTNLKFTCNTLDLNKYDCIELSSGATEYSMTLNAADVETLIAKGMRVQGYGTTLSKVELIFTVTGIKSVANTEKTFTSGPIFNLAGQRVDASYKGLVIKNGKKYINK